MKKRQLVCCGLAAGALWVGAPIAEDGMTELRPAASGEASHEQILERVYGVDFAASGSDYAGGGINVRRVDDAADRVVSLDGADRIDFVAAFTGWQWDVGLRDASGRTVASTSQNGSGFDAAGGFDLPAGSGPLEMTIDHESGRRYGSGDSLDQLVTYEVSGENAGDETLFFWEDWSRREGSDADFNDLVLRASAGIVSDAATEPAGGGAPESAAATTSIPLPPAAWPGAIGLALATYTAIRRHRRPR